MAAPVAAQDSASSTDSAKAIKAAACKKVQAYGKQVMADSIKAHQKAGTLTQNTSGGVLISAPDVKVDLTTAPDSIRTLAATAGPSCNPTPDAMGMVMQGNVLQQAMMQPAKPRPILGLRPRALTSRDSVNGLPDRRGVMVQSVSAGFGAAAAGIVAGDVIVAIDDKPTASLNDLQQQASQWKEGQEVTVEVVRKDGSRQKMKATIKMGK